MKTIVWDVDDVLNDLMRVWFEQFWLPVHHACKIAYQEIRENPPHRLLEVTKEEYLKSLDDFRLSGLYHQLKPVKEVRNWFAKNGAKSRHVALTKVPVVASPVSASWVLTHFGKWIRSFHFIPSKREGGDVHQYDENKGTYLNYFGKADLLIDDTLENIEAARGLGVKRIIFPRPWNSSKSTIAETLEEISEFIRRGLK